MLLVIIFLFVFGAVVGSFINVLIYRLPRGEGVVMGRSKCPHCRKTLKWHDLIPLISYLILSGRCRYCKKTISWSYFAVELYSGVIFLCSYFFFADGGILLWLANIVLLEVFLTLFVTDLKELILPDSVIFAGVIVALAGAKYFNSISFDHLLTAVFFLAFFWAVWRLSKGTWLGLGDGKLMFLVGLVFGALNSIVILYMAVIIGALAALVLLLFRKANLKTQLPLGSFICLSASVYIFWGYGIINRLNSIGFDLIPKLLK